MVRGNSNKRNAYYYFMEEFRNQHGRKLTLAEAGNAAGPHWERLTPKQKQKYENMAKAGKENQQKQTSMGESVEYVLQQEQEKKDREMLMKLEIDNIMKRGMNTETIAGHNFYLMHINEFCYWESSDRYYPAEIAVGKFNLKNGIVKEDVYHSLVQPGPLPLGYAALAKTKSEETHQIQHQGPDNNMEEVFSNIMNKLCEDAVGDSLPPIYVSEKNTPVVKNVLENMYDNNEHNYEFKVYSLEYMLYALKNAVSSNDIQSKAWPTISASILQLERDVYDFCSGIACPYHENSEIPVYCSRSQIIRWAYIICDNCVGNLDIQMIPGRHVPANSLIAQKTVSSASSKQKGGSSKRSYAPSLASGTTTSTKYHTDIASETGTVVDESEASSYHGFDSDSQVADDEEEWRQPRRPMRHRNAPQQFSQQSHPSENSQLSQASSTAEYIPARRPVSQSAVVPGFGRLTISNIGRGRGRGVLQTRPPM